MYCSGYWGVFGLLASLFRSRMSGAGPLNTTPSAFRRRRCPRLSSISPEKPFFITRHPGLVGVNFYTAKRLLVTEMGLVHLGFKYRYLHISGCVLQQSSSQSVAFATGIEPRDSRTSAIVTKGGLRVALL